MFYRKQNLKNHNCWFTAFWPTSVDFKGQLKFSTEKKKVFFDKNHSLNHTKSVLNFILQIYPFKSVLKEEKDRATIALLAQRFLFPKINIKLKVSLDNFQIMHLFISCTLPAFLSDLYFPDVPSLGGTLRTRVTPFLSTLHFARLNGITPKSKNHLDSLDISIPNILGGAQKDTHGTDNPGAQVTAWNSLQLEQILTFWKGPFANKPCMSLSVQ